ncbi:hypothetical protein PSTT_06912 [Puccinia striiformis]|uniref:Uncharacterized protein n=1 Tax=Puccinia striiformis TaxID=27350 RepID=A0A2S4VIH0_9BASI|nr:hypothetical protein PSTT_06912 [Puccinia striiformis]
MTPDRHSVFRHHTPSEKDIRQQKIQTLPLSTKNRSTKALSTKEIGGICQACINAAATKTPAITPQILHPANPLIVSRDEKQNKRQEAVARATQLYNPSVGNPSTFIPLNQSQLSFGGRPFRAIASAAISMSSSVPQNLDSIPQIIGPAYDSTRTARVASFDPYPTSQASRATAKRSKAPAPPKPPANKVRPVVHYVKWALADAYTELKRELCDKFCGKVELVTRPNEDQEIFTADHFPYYLDRQEEEACTNQARSYALRSGITPQDTNTRASPDSDISIVSSLPSAGAITESAIAASTITGESTTTQESTTSKSQIESHTTKVKIPTPENIPRARTTRSQNAEGAIPPMDLTNLLGEDQLVFVKITPPFCAEQGARRPSLIPRISLGTDLGRWTTHSLWFRGMDDSGWVDGVRYELNPDGLSMTQRICLYKVDYKKCLKLKESTKVISA